MKKCKEITILITGGALTPNKGAGAMTYVAIDIAKELGAQLAESTNIRLLSDFPEQDAKFLQDPGVEILDEKKGLTSSSSLNKMLEFGLSFLVWIPGLKSLINGVGNLSAYREADVLLDVSGDACGDGYKKGVLVVMRRLIVAFHYRIPIYVLPQSLGPFEKRVSRILVRRYFPKFRMIFYRESITKEILDSLSLKNTHYSPDLAFHLNPDKTSADKFHHPGRKSIGISVSNSITRYAMGDEDKDLEKRYIRTFRKFIETFQDEYDILFVNHVLGPGQKNDDRKMAEKIMKGLASTEHVTNVTDDLSAMELKGIISTCDFFIGSRMHSNISALSSSVPAIAVSYSHKFLGIMKMFGLEGYVIPFDELEDTVLIETFKKEVSSSDTLRKSMKEVNAKIAKDGREMKKKLLDDLRSELFD